MTRMTVSHPSTVPLGRPLGPMLREWRPEAAQRLLSGQARRASGVLAPGELFDANYPI